MTPKVQVVMAKPSRYKVLEGGRGGTKSYSFADALVCKTSELPLRILCTRETQNSIRDSVHKLLSDRIAALELDSFFQIKRESIISSCGSEFIFKGLLRNINEIKSTEGIDICWIEEAEKVSANSLDVLIPTIRKPNSEIWISFNPEDEDSPVYQRFIVSPPPDCRHAHITFRDNKFFPEVLRREMEYDKRVDHDKYLHVWEGQLKKYSDALIFKDKIFIEEFDTPEGIQLYFGADWGFSVDPTTLVRMFIQERCLYIDYEFYGHEVEIDDLERAFDTVPGVRKWTIKADSARPETISHVARQGFSIVGAEKGKGSVEDGIEFLRSFEKIIIHPRCKGAINNFTNYRWKQDRVTQEILPIPLDKSNHSPDAVRYALEDYIKSKEFKISWL